MLAQTILLFKLNTTQDTITPQAGLMLFGEYLQTMGLASHLDRELPRSLSDRG
jgi:hypothetical protein